MPKKYDIEDLQPGMKFTKPLFTEDNNVLLQADVPLKENVNIVAKIMKGEMENVADRHDWVTVPLVANIEEGHNWWDMRKLELD